MKNKPLEYPAQLIEVLVQQARGKAAVLADAGRVGAIGEVAEWPKARHWKCRIRETVSRVQIPPSPPNRTSSTRRPDDYLRPPGCFLDCS